MATANNGQFVKGFTPWNKGKRIIKTCTHCENNFSGRGVKYCSLQCAGKARLGMIFSDNLGREKGCIAWNKGKKCPQLAGENNTNWKGGVTVRLVGTDQSELVTSYTWFDAISPDYAPIDFITGPLPTFHKS